MPRANSDKQDKSEARADKSSCNLNHYWPLKQNRDPFWVCFGIGFWLVGTYLCRTTNYISTQRMFNKKQLLWQSWKDICELTKSPLQQLQLILRKIHKMRCFPWLSVFLLHRWKYKRSESNTILKLKITVLSQKFIIFCCLLLSFSRHMRRKREQYKHGLQRVKRTI